VGRAFTAVARVQVRLGGRTRRAAFFDPLTLCAPVIPVTRHPPPIVTRSHFYDTVATLAFHARQCFPAGLSVEEPRVLAPAVVVWAWPHVLTNE